MILKESYIDNLIIIINCYFNHQIYCLRLILELLQKKLYNSRPYIISRLIIKTHALSILVRNQIKY